MSKFAVTDVAGRLTRKAGKACLYVRRLADVDLVVLEKLNDRVGEHVKQVDGANRST
jgi:hypothetical protein